MRRIRTYTPNRRGAGRASRVVCGVVAWGWATIPRPGPRQAPTRERPYGRAATRDRPYGSRRGASIRRAATRERPYVGEGGHEGAPLRGACYGLPLWGACRASRVLVASRVGVGDDSPPRAPPGAHKGAPLRRGGRPRGSAPTSGRAATRERPYGFAPAGGVLRIAPVGRVSRVARVRGVARGGGRRFPAPGPARRPQGSAPTVRVAGRPYGGRPQGSAPTVLPLRGACYGLRLRGAGRASRVVCGVARGGGRRCPAPFPARRPQGSAPTSGRAPTRERPYGSRRGASIRRAATRERPYGFAPVGACYGLPLWGACRAARGFVASSRGGGRRFPAPGPARRPQGSAPTEGRAATRERPYGFAPVGACYGLRLRGACYGLPLWGACRAAARFVGDDVNRRGGSRRGADVRFASRGRTCGSSRTVHVGGRAARGVHTVAPIRFAGTWARSGPRGLGRGPLGFCLWSAGCLLVGRLPFSVGRLPSVGRLALWPGRPGGQAGLAWGWACVTGLCLGGSRRSAGL